MKKRTEKRLSQCCDTFSAYNKGGEYVFTYSTPFKTEYSNVSQTYYTTF